MAFVTPVVEHWLEREIAQCVHHEGSIRRPIAPWANALTTEIHLAPPWHKSMCIACDAPLTKQLRGTASAYDAICRRIDPTWQTHWVISCYRQCSTTEVTNVVVCTLLLWDMHIKDHLLLVEKSSPWSSGSRFQYNLYIMQNKKVACDVHVLIFVYSTI